MQAIEKLENRFSQARGSGTLTTERPTPGGARDDPSTWETRTSRVDFAIDRDFNRVTIRSASEEGGSSFQEERVYCTSPESSFRLERSQQTAPFLLTSVSSGIDSRLLSSISRFAGGYVSAPYSMVVSLMVPVSDLMKRPYFQVTDVTEVIRDGRRLLRFDLEFEPLQSLPVCSAWILVSPEEGWVTREFEGMYGSNRDVPVRGKFEYGEMIDGVAMPRVVTYSHPSYRHRFEFDDLQLESSPAREFTLAAFGLPDLGASGSPRHGNRMGYYLIGAAVLALVASVVLKSLQVRPLKPQPRE